MVCVQEDEQDKKTLIVGILIRTVVACFCNACITLPLYAKAMGMR